MPGDENDRAGKVRQRGWFEAIIEDRVAAALVAAAVLAVAGSVVGYRLLAYRVGELERERDKCIKDIRANTENHWQLRREFDAHTAFGRQWIENANDRQRECCRRIQRLEQKAGG